MHGQLSSELTFEKFDLSGVGQTMEEAGANSKKRNFTDIMWVQLGELNIETIPKLQLYSHYVWSIE